MDVTHMDIHKGLHLPLLTHQNFGNVGGCKKASKLNARMTESGFLWGSLSCVVTAEGASAGIPDGLTQSRGVMSIVPHIPLYRR